MSEAVGKPLNRVDGRLKVTGGARYSAEIPVEGVVHAVLVGSTIARGRIRSIDTRAALRAPGVLAVLTHLNIPKLAKQPKFVAGGVAQSFAPMQGSEIYYSGQHVAIVIADTLERATHAATLVQVSYRQEKPIVTMHDARARVYQPKAIMGGFAPGRTVRGNPSQAMAQAPVRLSETYTLSTNHHNPIEPWSTIAVWEGDNLTLYESTAGVTRSQTDLANLLGLPPANVRVVAHFVGGTFGGKNNTWPHPALAAIAARYVRRPVKLVLTRQQMYTCSGHREEQVLRLTLGATRSGRLTAIAHEKTSPTSPFDEFAEPTGNVINMMYACPNFETTYKLVRVNMMTPTFTRAPGEAPGMFALECAMDELAYKLGLDPIEIRLRNHADRDPITGNPWSSKSLKECYRQGAERFGWSRRNPEPRSMQDGHYLIGYGMASATYPVYRAPASARARILSDGSAIVQSGAADLGTGTYTVMTQVAADALGLAPERVRFELGDTKLPTAPNAGGSVTAGAVSSAVHVATTAVRRKVTQMAIKDGKSPLYGAQEDAVAIENGRLFLKGDRNKGETYGEMLNRLGLTNVEAQGTWQPDAEGDVNPNGSPQDAQEGRGQKYAMHSFGADFVEVRVDPDLGQVRVTRMLGVFGAGRILNAKTARSQLSGGMVWGLSQALHEHTHMDAGFGRYTNANLGEYLVPVNADIPDIEVEFVEERDPHINVLGVKGIGEIGIVGVAAAIANAIFHATGKRIRDLPITPDKLL